MKRSSLLPTGQNYKPIKTKNNMETQTTKKELAKELYEVVSSYENVSFATVYQKSFFTKEKVLKYIGKAQDYSNPRIAY